MALKKVIKRDPNKKEQEAKENEIQEREVSSEECKGNANCSEQYLGELEQQEQDKEARLEQLETEESENIAIIDISNLQPAKAKANSSGNKQTTSSFKVINTPKSGKRIVIKEEIVEYLETKDIEIGFGEGSMVLVAKGVNINECSYAFRKDKSNYILYNANLVAEITEHFELDFTKTTTVGLKIIKAKTADGTKLIKIINN